MSTATFRLPAALLMLALAGAASGSEDPILLGEQQLSAAGVQFIAAVTPDPSSGASLALTGRVVVPNAGIEPVLAPMDARVEALLVNPGESVRAGQVLARLHSAGLLAMQRELVAARARLQVDAARASRDEQLHAEGIIARNRLEESQARAIQSQAGLSEQQQLLRLAGMSQAAIARIGESGELSPLLALTARRNGQVLEQLAGPGEAVEAGMPLLRLANLDTLWLELQATREQAARIRTGDVVEVAACAPGKVLALAPQVGAQSQTMVVRVQIARADGCVVPNQFVEARLNPRADAPDMVQVPAASIVQLQGRQYVFVKNAAGIEPRQVEVERRGSGVAWITGPVKAGEAVASAGVAALKGSWQGYGAAEAP